MKKLESMYAVGGRLSLLFFKLNYSNRIPTILIETSSFNVYPSPTIYRSSQRDALPVHIKQSVNRSCCARSLLFLYTCPVPAKLLMNTVVTFHNMKMLTFT